MLMFDTQYPLTCADLYTLSVDCFISPTIAHSEMENNIPDKQPKWFKAFEKSLNENSKKLSELIDSTNFVSEGLKDLGFEMKELKKENNLMKAEHAELQKENVKLKDEVNELKRNVEYMELQSRRNNLLIDGLPEKQNSV